MSGSANYIRGGLLGGCAAGVLMFAAAAHAQDAAPSPGPEATTQVDEIIVTGQRRSERLIDVPMSIVAVTPQTIERSGVVSIHDISSIVPGVQVNFGGGFTQPAVRGVTTLTTGVGFENNVATYIDGFYAPDNVTINADLANISSVEVLKGPQGTLWGRNATGGAILITTKAPSAVPTGSLQLAYGRYNDRSVTAYYSGPLNDRIRYSLAAYGRQSDGYNKLIGPTGAVIGDASPLTQISVRAKVDVDLSADLVATLGYNYGVADDIRGQLFTYYANISPAIAGSPGLATQPYTFSSNRETLDRGETNEGTARLVWNIPSGTVTSYTGLARRDTDTAFDFDGSQLDLTYAVQQWVQTTFQQGIDYNITAFKGLDLVVGGTYYRDRLENRKQLSYAANTLISNFTGELNAEAFAVYIDGSYHLTDRLVLSAGGRYTYETKEAEYKQVRPDGSDLVPPGSGSKDFSAFTPRASIRYELAEHTNIYASYSRGFRTGGFSPNVAISPDLFLPFEPEKIGAFEVGYKTSGSNFSFSTAAFYYDYQGLQVGVTVPNPVCAACNVITLVSNAPEATVYGVDGQLNFTPIERLNLRLGAAYLHARYGDFPNATATGYVEATGLNRTGQVQDWTGQQMARSPTFSGNLGVDYEFLNVLGGSLLVSSNVLYTDSYVLSNPSLYGPLANPLVARKQRFRQPSYTLLNLQAGWSDASQTYKVTFYVNNATDRRYRLTSNGGAFGNYSSWASPRSYGVRLGYAF